MSIIPHTEALDTFCTKHDCHYREFSDDTLFIIAMRRRNGHLLQKKEPIMIAQLDCYGDVIIYDDQGEFSVDIDHDEIVAVLKETLKANPNSFNEEKPNYLKEKQQ